MRKTCSPSLLPPMQPPTLSPTLVPSMLPSMLPPMRLLLLPLSATTTSTPANQVCCAFAAASPTLAMRGTKLGSAHPRYRPASGIALAQRKTATVAIDTRARA